jgi:hypothetical protein
MSTSSRQAATSSVKSMHVPLLSATIAEGVRRRCESSSRLYVGGAK